MLSATLWAGGNWRLSFKLNFTALTDSLANSIKKGGLIWLVE